jgi:ABC-type transport system substrate-binding protein
VGIETEVDALGCSPTVATRQREAVIEVLRDLARRSDPRGKSTQVEPNQRGGREAMAISQQAVTSEERAPAGEPVGTVNVVDPHPLNWLFVTWNTMEEPVRTDEHGHLVGAAMEDSRWIDDTTFEIDLRRGVRYQDGEEFTAANFKRAFDETQRWKAPHPPGTYLNFHPDTRLEIVDDHKVRMVFPEPDGLVLGKFRGFHLPSTRFWDELGFGYKAIGTGEGHW